MRSIACNVSAQEHAATRIVCLPAAFTVLEDFLTEGFDRQVRARALPIDLRFVDPELHHVGDRSFRERLKRDIVLPARAEGCRCLWLAGISLGGYVALDYVASHPGEVDGVCLLAPYLGNRLVTGEIAAARGLGSWSPGELAEADEERRIWRFIQQQDAGARLLYLGCGSEDRFAQAHALLAAWLPPRSVNVVQGGGHDWHTWTRLWEDFLDSRFT